MRPFKSVRQAQGIFDTPRTDGAEFAVIGQVMEPKTISTGLSPNIFSFTNRSPRVVISSNAGTVSPGAAALCPNLKPAKSRFIVNLL
jgi:hypothetical protein